MIRGLALRSLCSLKLPTIVEYVIPLLRSGVKVFVSNDGMGDVEEA